MTRSLSNVASGLVLPALLGGASAATAAPAPYAGGIEALVGSSADYGVRNF